MTYKCPIENVVINVRCPVTTCIWHSSTVKTGCLHGSDVLDSDQYLAQVKGLAGPEALEKEVAAATQRIECLLILDRWCSQLKDEPAKVPRHLVGYLNRLIAKWPQFSREQGWSINSLYLALSQKQWRRFKRSLSSNVIHRKVLGLSRAEYESIQQRLSSLEE